MLKKGEIRRCDVMEICALSPDQASRLLNRLVKNEALKRHGVGKGSWYEKNGKGRVLFTCLEVKIRERVKNLRARS